MPDSGIAAFGCWHCPGYVTKVTRGCSLEVQPHPKVKSPPEGTSLGFALDLSRSQPVGTGQGLDQARKREA